jgi:hypothetical protein
MTIIKLLLYIKIKLKQSFIINGLSQYYGNTSCHYQAKISKEKTNTRNSNTKNYNK